MEETTAQAPTTKRVLLTSLAVDTFDLVMNSTVAALTGSAIMLVEAMEGFAGLISVLLLLTGNRRGGKRPNKLHPFGHNTELFYWSTIAAFVVVTAVGVVAIRFGYEHFVGTPTIRHSYLAYIALAIALITNVYSLWLSLGKLVEDQPRRDVLKIFMNSPTIAPKTVAVLDAMGSIVALCGLLSFGLYGITGNQQLDAIGAVAMGFALLLSAFALLMSVRSLVMGQGATREMERRLRDVAREIPEVKHVVGMRTLMVGSDKLLVNIEVHLKDGMTTDQVEQAVVKIKEAMEQAGIDEGLQIHVEPDALEEQHPTT